MSGLHKRAKKEAGLFSVSETPYYCVTPCDDHDTLFSQRREKTDKSGYLQQTAGTTATCILQRTIFTCVYTPLPYTV